MRPYVLVSGDFTTLGGMDRANYALAWHLADRRGARVHLAAFRVHEPLASHPNVTWHRVPKLLNSYTLAEDSIRRAARRLAGANPQARVIVNGGGGDWPDVNWVHALHAAWPCRHAHAPALFRARSSFYKWRARRRERRAIRRARFVIVNSDRTREQVIRLLGVEPARVHRVYYGVDSQLFQPPTDAARNDARATLELPLDRQVIAFIGALGWDRNKGFDILFDAFAKLTGETDRCAILLAAGAGAEVPHWQARARQLGLSDRVRIIGFTDRIISVLHAADLLVAPSGYESYGLAAHEALCCGVPAMVSAVSGIAERYPAELRGLIIDDPTDVAALAQRLRDWHRQAARYRSLTATFGEQLRRRTWDDMACQMLSVIESDEVHKVA